MSDNRNVVDFYKYWKNEAILADLDEKRNNFSVICCNIVGDFNISSVIRSANAFLAREVVIYGRRRFDRRGAVGTQNYTHFKFVKEIGNLTDYINNNSNLFICGIDNIPSASSIVDFKWPADKHTIMIFGEESVGIPADVLALCNAVAYIPQYGSVRSLNVGVAAGIAMSEFCRRLK